MNTAAVHAPGNTLNRRASVVVAAEVMFTLCQTPVAFTTGVWPTGPRWSRRGSRSGSRPRRRSKGGAVGRGPLPDRRELLVPPALHGLGVGLPDLPQRPLRGQAQLGQQPTHADRGPPDVELPADQLADQVSGPQRDLQLQLPRIAAHDQRVQPAQLVAFRFGGLPRTGLAFNAARPPSRYLASHMNTVPEPSRSPAPRPRDAPRPPSPAPPRSAASPTWRDRAYGRRSRACSTHTQNRDQVNLLMNCLVPMGN